ncbi:MAG: cupin domain-containing protein [Lachnospiraceae bacterium]|nr:cupin domain-containing protein [Lachnospiraceae bacterium]
MKCVILAGGAGDRLWPLSRKNDPKQFLRLGRDISIFQDTITRNLSLCDGFLIVTNRDYRDIVENQMQMFQGISYQVILEEEGRGTAAAVALAILSYPEDEEILIMPSDLIISGENYSELIYEGREKCRQDRIVLYGITPENPQKSYGYIRHSGDEVTRFIEKPSAELAREIFSEPDVLWNSGMILGRVGVIFDELKKQASEFLRRMRPVFDQGQILDAHTTFFTKELFNDIEKHSIEQLLLEGSDRLSVIRLRCKWSDVSDFSSIEKLLENDGAMRPILNDSEDVSVINSDASRLVVVNGIRNAYVITTPDVTYVTDKSGVNKIKDIMREKAADYGEYFNENPLVGRTWGTREVIHREPGYRVRKIVIYPGGSISRHTHEKRNENYSVVSGVLSVELEDRTVELKQGDGINILPGMIHRVYNGTDIEVVAIEVDTGEEIEEQDKVYSDTESHSELPSLYRLHPAYKDYLWGGTTLRDKYGKDTPYDITAESWELSAHSAGPSQIIGGTFDKMNFDEFVRQHGDEVLGWKSTNPDRFPLLVKFIDAKNKLSIQIHPDDDYAFVNEGEFGKNEVWYVMDVEPGAYLYCGLRERATAEELKKRLADNSVTELLNRVEVKKGDVIFIPTGTIHAIGAGVFICEIQQSSDSTYRLYDYDRIDKDGKKRPLHIEKALDVVDLEPYVKNAYGYSEPITDHEGNVAQTLCRCKYFESTKYDVHGELQLRMDDSSFLSLVVLSGSGRVYTGDESMEFGAGESIFIPAGRKVIHVAGSCEFIATHV